MVIVPRSGILSRAISNQEKWCIINNIGSWKLQITRRDVDAAIPKYFFINTN